MTTVCVSTSLPSTVSFNGLPLKSIASTALPNWILAPNRSACCCISIINSVPSMPLAKPGKFSTMLVVVSKPPGIAPVNTSGSRLARAV